MKHYRPARLTQLQVALLCTPLALVVVPFLLLPLLLGFLGTFTNYAPFQSNLQFVGLNNYLTVVRDNIFQTALRNTVSFTAASVSIEVGIGFTLAFALRKPFRGRSIVRVGLLLPWLVSPVATGIMWHFLLNTNQGLLNYFPSLLGLPDVPYPITVGTAMQVVIAVEIWRKTPFVTFLLLPGIIGIPAEQWDQARLDGLAALNQMRHIALPALRVLMLTILLLLIGDALGTFENILMLTGGGPGTSTLTLGFYTYSQAIKAFNWRGGATSGWFIVGAISIIGLGYIRLTRSERL